MRHGTCRKCGAAVEFSLVYQCWMSVKHPRSCDCPRGGQHEGGY